MMPEHTEDAARSDTVEHLVGWASTLDRCDGYVVVLGDPHEPRRAYGPYDGRGALHAADRLAGAVDVPVHVVRLHHPRR